MTRTLAITRRQAQTLLKAANEEGGIIEIDTAIGTIRLIPKLLAKSEPIDKEPAGYL